MTFSSYFAIIYPSNMGHFVLKKTEEICFALLRVAAHIRRPDLRLTIERLTYHLLENISYENAAASAGSINAIRNFLTLAKNVYELEPVNAKILDRELEQILKEVQRFGNLSDLPDLETFFTQKLPVRQSPKKSERVPEEVVIPNEEIRNEEVEYGNEETGNEEVSMEMRKEKIIDMISSSPERRLSLKDIASAFPEVSTRTIRNDLKTLFDEKRVIRQGSGGPANYYTVNQALSVNGFPAPSVM